MESVSEITVNCMEIKTVCPHCGAEEEGWIFDPRGDSTKCESCGNSYTVDSDADVVID